MSLLKKLDRLHRAVRREAKRNPAFAAALERALAREAWALQIDEGAEIAPAPAPAPTPAAFNPAAVYGKEGEEGLRAALIGLDAPALRFLIEEHNLDPAGETRDLDRVALIAHTIAAARRRTERDVKLFDY